MKTRVLATALSSAVSVFLLLVMAGGATKAEEMRQLASIPPSGNSTIASLESISLRNTATIRFTPAFTVYLPAIAKAYPCIATYIRLYQNNNPLNRTYIHWSSATRVDTFTVHEEIQGLSVTLNLCSQSLTNYTQNSVLVCFIKNGNVIACKGESYDSESTWGTPIPCYNHVLNFPDLRFKVNESINMSTTVTSGDWVNFLNQETVSGKFCAH